MTSASHPDTPSPVTIGIDFGGTSVKSALVRGAETLTEIDRLPTGDFDSSDALVDAIAANIAARRESNPEIRAVGIGVPGAVDFPNGVTYNLTNVPGWGNVPLRDILSEKTGLPVAVDNDANCVAYAEYRFGSARGLANVIAITLGTGVGGGLVLDGKPYRGAQFAAGEIGQISIDYHGVDGPYGNQGALERYVGHRQISEHALRRYLEAGRPKTHDETDPNHLAEAARNGDPVALHVWRDVALWLGTALCDLVWILNPDALVIGGGVAHAGDVLLDPLREKMQSALSPEFWQHLQILPAKFGHASGIVGAAALAADLVHD